VAAHHFFWVKLDNIFLIECALMKPIESSLRFAKYFWAPIKGLFHAFLNTAVSQNGTYLHRAHLERSARGSYPRPMEMGWSAAFGYLDIRVTARSQPGLKDFAYERN
jgi:hypothetical protein